MNYCIILLPSPLILCSQGWYHLFFGVPDQEEAARCGRLPGGSQSGLHSAGHRLQWGEPHVDEAECPHGEEAHQRHPPAPSDLQWRQLLRGKYPGTKTYHSEDTSLLTSSALPLKMYTRWVHRNRRWISFISMQDYDTFFDAKEDNTVYSFLGLPPPPGSKVGTIFSSLLMLNKNQNKIISIIWPLC